MPILAYKYKKHVHVPQVILNIRNQDSEYLMFDWREGQGYQISHGSEENPCSHPRKDFIYY